MNDFVTVIMPAYNASLTIMSALNSVFNQTYKFIEVVVVDDGSTDSTIELLERLHKVGKIKLISQENYGVSVARNTGVKHASSDLITFIDADDLLDVRKIERQVLEIQARQCDVVLTGIKRFHEDNNDIIFFNETIPPEFNLREDYLKSLFILNTKFMAHMTTALMKKRIFIDAGGYNEKLVASEDWDLWIRLASSAVFCNIDDCLYFYRKHFGSSSANFVHYNVYISQMYILKSHKKTIDSMKINFSNVVYIKQLEFMEIFANHGLFCDFFKLFFDLKINCELKKTIYPSKLVIRMLKKCLFR